MVFPELCQLTHRQSQGVDALRDSPVAGRALQALAQFVAFGGLELVGTFCDRVRELGDRLGPVLCQFPPTRPRDDGMLRLLLDTIDPELEVAFEFRHDSWTGADVPVRVNSLEGEGPFRYLRLREPPYDDAALAAWAGRLRPLLEDGVRVYCYFKHEDEPTGPAYAQRLRQLLISSITS
jgi:uncharacterized protein YecE (DUF72 family)